MKHLKKFFELFDTEELKSENEISYLQGKFNKMKIDNNFKDEDIAKLISKIAMVHFPFMEIFNDSGFSDQIIKFKGFDCFVTDFDGKYWVLVTISERYSVVLGVKIESVNKYDIFICLDDVEDDSNIEEFEYSDISFARLIDLMRTVYIPFIKEYGFSDVLLHNSDLPNINN